MPLGHCFCEPYLKVSPSQRDPTYAVAVQGEMLGFRVISLQIIKDCMRFAKDLVKKIESGI